MTTGASRATAAPQENSQSGMPAALRLSGVGFRHAGGQAVLNEIELSVAPGERVAIIGPSGAGKTTLLRLIASHLRPQLGQLELLGCEPWRMSASARRRLRTRIGMIHQAPPLPPRQRVVTAVLAGRLGQWSLGRGLMSLIHPLDSVGAAEALARLDLADKLYERCDQLSGGQLQRVGIARVLYQRPDLMLADEPVSAMDPILARHALGVLSEDARQRGATLLASLHAVELAMDYFPRVIGVRGGRILFDKPASQVSPAELDALYANEQLTGATPSMAPVQHRLHVPRC